MDDDGGDAATPSAGSAAVGHVLGARVLLPTR